MNKDITTEIAVFQKEDFEDETITFFWNTVNSERKIKSNGLEKEYGIFTMEDMNFLINHPNIPQYMRPALAKMMNQVNYIPKQHSPTISKYFFCIFF
jgi:hypothetical protein